MNPLLTIAIPTLNNLSQLNWTLTTLLKYTEFPYRIVVVDNGCLHEVKMNLARWNFAELSVLEPEKNLGWMGAINLALESCDTKFFCMLNDDVCFIPERTEFWRILALHCDNSAVGAVGPSSNFVAGTQSLMYIDVPTVFETSLLIGFCMLLRTEVFKSIGGLDKSLPGGDDLDLSIRLLQKGFSLRVDKAAYLHHIGQQTGKRVHGENWDSDWMQEVTNNALVKKHGMKAWYETYQAQWKNLPVFSPEILEDTEEIWYEKELEGFEGAQGIDIGCGGTRRAHRKFGGFGLDIRRSGEGAGAGGQKHVEVKNDIMADAMALPVATGSQDYLVASHIIEHLIDPIAALQNWFQALKSGGKLILSCPDHAEVETMLIDYSHIHGFTEESLVNLLLLVGFEVDGILAHRMGSLRVVCHKPLPSRAISPLSGLERELEHD
jgi:GT2 family glycosyltransferase